MGIYQTRQLWGAGLGAVGLALMMASCVLGNCDCPPEWALFTACSGGLLIASGMIVSAHYSGKIQRGEQAITPF